MRCLIAALLALGVIIGAAVAAWNWWGWWGLAAWFFGGYSLLWLLSKIGPGTSAAFFRGMYAELAEGMREATVTLNSIERATESDPVHDVVQSFEDWMRESEADDTDGLHFDLSEFLTHCEIRLDCGRFLVDFTVTPPAENPDVQWAPHGFSLVPYDAEADKGFSCEMLQWEDYDAESSRFLPSKLETAYEEIQGERRIRVLAALDEDHREYRFEYLFSVRYDNPIVLPRGTDAISPTRRLTVAILESIARAHNESKVVKSIDLAYLAVNDSDLPQLKELPELEYLGLDGTEVTDDGIQDIAKLTTLQQLSLNGTTIGDAALKSIAGLPNLKRLFVRESNVTKPGCVSFRAVRPDIKVYH